MIALIVAQILFVISCSPPAVGEIPIRKNAGSETVPTPEVEPTKFQIPPELLNVSSQKLCDRLAEIKVLPHKDPNETDPIYEALIAKKEGAYPCLIAKITDSSKVPDPRQAPHWEHYSVGDTAVFILVRSLSKDDDRLASQLLVNMLPPAYQKEWKTNGVYAYFNYVSEPNNRKQLQQWWKNCLSKNKK
ncbi:MAG: hypothetical protein ACT4O9_03550 [Blastocatellia bacterium]